MLRTVKWPTRSKLALQIRTSGKHTVGFESGSRSKGIAGGLDMRNWIHEEPDEYRAGRNDTDSDPDGKVRMLPIAGR